MTFKEKALQKESQLNIAKSNLNKAKKEKQALIDENYNLDKKNSELINKNKNLEADKIKNPKNISENDKTIKENETKIQENKDKITANNSTIVFWENEINNSNTEHNKAESEFAVAESERKKVVNDNSLSLYDKAKRNPKTAATLVVAGLAGAVVGGINFYNKNLKDSDTEKKEKVKSKDDKKVDNNHEDDKNLPEYQQNILKIYPKIDRSSLYLLRDRDSGSSVMTDLKGNEFYFKNDSDLNKFFEKNKDVLNF